MRYGSRAALSGRRLAVALGLTGLLLAGPLTKTGGAAAGGTTPIQTISDEMTVSYYGYPQTLAPIRTAPSDHARAITKLHWLTEDGQEEVYLALAAQQVNGHNWLEIRVPKRPNGITGWVPASALDPLQVVYGHLEVNRETLRATLYDRNDQPIWSAPVGVGRPSLPTPAGHFYVREKLRSIGGPVYGPFALGTSAYAPSLSEWPGGGVVGIHGTDQPQLIPGRPSHGCVRMRNSDITQLWRQISIGEPIDIT
jgi:hypothetical protein